MKKRVLITGIGGFVGSHTCEHLLKNTDWDIVGIDSFRHKGDQARLDHLRGPRLQVITHDLYTPLSVRRIDQIGAIDYLLNVASESHVDRSITDPVPFIRNNVELMLNVLEYARIVKPQKFIQCSTDEVFGPAPEGVEHSEWYPYLPSNPYAASKACQNAIGISYWRTYDVPLILTHCMNLTGERQDTEKFIPLLISKISKGEVVSIHGSESYIGKRHYLHCRNLADAWLFLLKEIPAYRYKDSSELQMPTAFCVVGEVEMDNLEVAQFIAKVMGKELNYELVDFHKTRQGHDRRYALDGRKIASVGWKPPVKFHESLEKTIEWTLRPENSRWLL